MNGNRREERFSVETQGRYRAGRGIGQDVVVLDLSTHGCRFFDRFCNLSEGANLTIRIGNIGPLEARVQWTKGEMVGVRFEAPLHTSVLEHMVTTIPDWKPATETVTINSAAESSQMQPLHPGIVVRIRPPSEADVRMALRECQLALPLRTEAEVEAVFHRILERIHLSEG